MDCQLFSQATVLTHRPLKLDISYAQDNLEAMDMGLLQRYCAHGDIKFLIKLSLYLPMRSCSHLSCHLVTNFMTGARVPMKEKHHKLPCYHSISPIINFNAKCNTLPCR